MILIVDDKQENIFSLKMVLEQQGFTDPGEAAIPYMPQQAIALFEADYVAGTREIVAIINRLNR